MNRYFTIGEVSKIKGVSIKSLRYYDKIGVFTPAYINPDTGYRYYTNKQFFELDLISVCVELGIPLKSFNSYYDSKRQMNLKKLLNDSQEIANKKIKKIQLDLQMINSVLEGIEESNIYDDKKGIYERRFQDRYILTAPYEDSSNDTDQLITQLFIKANDIGAAPSYQAGLIYEFDKDLVKKHIFLEVLEKSHSPMIKTIPGGLFLCCRNSHSVIDQSEVLFESVFTEQEKVTAIEIDTLREKVSYDKCCYELQVKV